MIWKQRFVIIAAIALLMPCNLDASVETVQNAHDFPFDATQHSLSMKKCATGINSYLELGGISRSKRHNGNDGEAHLALKEKNNASVLWKNQYMGGGVCFGYYRGKQIYLIGNMYEDGIGVRLIRIIYVDEVGHKAQFSSFSENELEAFAAVNSSDCRYLAFVAIVKNKSWLYLLDVERDSIRRLGEAPLPPPLDKEERKFVRKHPDAAEGPWEWMGNLRDSYMQLDPGIVTFRNHTLIVSYGADTRWKRAKIRHKKIWHLN